MGFDSVAWLCGFEFESFVSVSRARPLEKGFYML